MTHEDAEWLRAVRLVHTLAWAFLAACVIGIPLAAAMGRIALASVLIAVVGVEVMVLAANKWKCPLTNVAARYTDDRGDNFDIYLPVWLARYNKQIFGPLYVAGCIFTIIMAYRAGY